MGLGSLRVLQEEREGSCQLRAGMCSDSRQMCLCTLCIHDVPQHLTALLAFSSLSTSSLPQNIPPVEALRRKRLATVLVLLVELGKALTQPQTLSGV